MRRWQEIWEAKGKRREAQPLAVDEDSILEELMALGGYDSSTSSLAKELYQIQLLHIVTQLKIEANTSAYEVGCGAGSLLFSLQNRCSKVGGCDYAKPLVDIARKVIRSRDLECVDAANVSTAQKYDVLISNGVFLYFPSSVYAEKALDRMMDKATQAIGVMDVNDASLRDEFEAARRAAQGEKAANYAGLEQLYLERDFFHEQAEKKGWKCKTEDSVMKSSINGRYRFNAFLYRILLLGTQTFPTELSLIQTIMVELSFGHV